MELMLIRKSGSKNRPLTHPTYTGAFNFVNGASQLGEYTYDQNGNMTKDLNKNISSISYNLLNLPTNVSYSSGKSAAYIYDATGKKLRTSYKASASATAVPTDYCGNMIYENNVLKQILIDGGYITFSGTAPYYHYYLKDHLGNNRVVVSPAGTTEQINHYYPFGGLFGESTGNTVQRFRYNGKELDRTHGIDWYDYGARHMTPDAGRFTTIDPLAEKYYNISPYAYCANNPIKHIDPNGREVRDGLGSYNKNNKDLKNLTQYLAKHNDPKSIMIVAHGVIPEGEKYASSINIQTYNPKTKEWNDNYISNGKDLSKFLSQNSKVWNEYKAGEISAKDMHIVLYACSSSEVAKQISSDSEFKNITFIAPNKDIGVSENSGVVVSDLIRTPDGKTIINNAPGKGLGNWNTYKNGKSPFINSQYSGNKNLKPGTAQFRYNYTF